VELRVVRVRVGPIAVLFVGPVPRGTAFKNERSNDESFYQAR
jgi:hypothetical protein